MKLLNKTIFLMILLSLGTMASSAKYVKNPEEDPTPFQENGFEVSQTSSDIYEPDDNYTSATPITIGENQSHTLYPAGDEDWMVFTLSNTTRVEIETMVGVDTVLYLYDENLTLITSDDDAGIGLGSKIIYDLNSGTYYIKVNGYSSTETGSYNITLNGFTLIDVYEPDDNYYEATQLFFNQTQYHSLYPVGERDWLFFTLNNSQGVTIETYASDADTYLFLYDSSLNQIASDDDSGVGFSSRIDAILPTGTYYVKVEGFANSSTGNYSIILTPYDLTDFYEPDDSSQNATVIFSGQTYQTHTIYPENDHDWLTFTVSDNATVEISVFPNVLFNTTVYLYDDLLNVIAMDDSSGSNNGSYIFAEILPGTYYIEIFASTVGDIGEYSLSIMIVEGSGDVFEPDNDFDNATPLFFDTPQNHSLLPETDVDFYRFNVTQYGLVTAETSGISGDTVMYLYDELHNQIDFNDDAGSLFSRISRYLDPGTYYIQVAPYGGYGIVPWYLISITFNNDSSVGGDSYEPDDTMVSANEITFGEVQEHSLTSGDVDYVYFLIVVTTRINIYTYGDVGDTVITLYDGIGNFIIQDDDSGKGLFSSITMLLDPGTYYLRVELFDANSPIDSYTISLREGFAPDAYEDDNDYSTATQLEFWMPQDHTFSENDWGDYFYFNLTQSMEVEIVTEGTDGDTHIILFDENRNYVVDIDDTDTSTFASLSIFLDVGSYYILVLGYFSFEYTITLRDPNSSPPVSSSTITTTTNTSSNVQTTNGSSSTAPSLDLPLNPLPTLLGLIAMAVIISNVQRRRK